MFKISIPKPCHVGWDNMQPEEKGRYCNNCAKTVMDFSLMSDEAVQQYFIANLDKQICGHFKNTQIERIRIQLPENIFNIQLPFWKKFLAFLLICFGGSFLGIDTSLAGSSYQQTDTSIYQADTTLKNKAQKLAALKKKKNKKKLSVEFRLQLIETLGLVSIKLPVMESMTTDGFCTIKKVDDTCHIFEQVVFDNILKEEKEKAGTDTNTIVKNSSPSHQPVKDHTPKTPEPVSTFILPTALAARNPFPKKKKA